MAGTLCLALIEGVRRKPVNMKVLEWVQTACATIIIGYMLYISFFDIGDLIGKDGDQKSPRKESPASTRRLLFPRTKERRFQPPSWIRFGGLETAALEADHGIKSEVRCVGIASKFRP